MKIDKNTSMLPQEVDFLRQFVFATCTRNEGYNGHILNLGLALYEGKVYEIIDSTWSDGKPYSAYHFSGIQSKIGAQGSVAELLHIVDLVDREHREFSRYWNIKYCIRENSAMAEQLWRWSTDSVTPLERIKAVFAEFGFVPLMGFPLTQAKEVDE